MAILDAFRPAVPFRALWIWSGSAPKKNGYVYLRKGFTLKAAPERAEIKLFANDRYILFINGHTICRGPAVGTDSTRFYDTVDVGQFLGAGNNVIGVAAYNHGPGPRNRIFKGPGGLIARMSVEFADNTLAEVSTDSSWKTFVPESRNHKAPRINGWDVGYYEVFDPEKEPTGWNMPGYDDSRWEQAQLLPAAETTAFGEIAPRPLAQLSYENIPPVKCAYYLPGGGLIKGTNNLTGNKKKKGSAVFDSSKASSRPTAVYDFGRIMSGRIRLGLTATKSGGMVTVMYGESLALTSMDAIKIGRGRVTWTSYGSRAFRYAGIAITGSPTPVKVDVLEAEEEFFDLGKAPAVRENKALRDMVSTAGNTLRASSRDYFIDCPGREQALWLGDVRIEALAAYNGFGESSLARHSINLFSMMQRRDGAIPAVGPLSGDAFLPDYHVQWPTIVHDYLMHTDDIEAVAQWRVPLSKAVAWMERELDGRSLIPRAERAEWWCFLDWAPYLPREGYSGILNLFAYEGFLSASRVARALGEEGTASRWLNHAESMRLAIYDNLFDREEGLFMDAAGAAGRNSHSQQVNALAVTSGLVDGKDAVKLIGRLLKKDSKPIGTPYFAWHYLEALLKTGHAAEGMNYMDRYWGEMTRRGATCYWEMFDPESPSSQSPYALPGGFPSRCHGWGTGIVATLVRHVAGTSPAEAGFKSVLLKPLADTAVLPFSMTFNLPIGKTRYSLKRNRNGVVSITYTLPRKLPLELVVNSDKADTLIINRKTVYSKTGPALIPNGTQVRKAGNNVIVAMTTDSISASITPCGD
ncbi:MAG: alpha-L-rhamnosidase N-terminal domain-containing protein [Planctomycetes bacterium]|nr:alpha-L-rhamnosidase N-terminal domain-containing protein [Planctomycetota bacterium]